MPRVSVILPNYNYARYLKERVRSILGQSYHDFEFIYLDDASEDESNLMMQDFVGDPRLQMHLFTENSGKVYQRWNDGAALATGDWLWFAGADDTAHPRFLERLLEMADTHPSAGLLFSRMMTMDGEGRLLALRWVAMAEIALRLETSYFERGYEEAVWLTAGCFVSSASAALIRRDAFIQAGTFDTRLWQTADWSLYLTLLQHHDIAYSAEPLVCYRAHQNTVTKKTQALMMALESACCMGRAYKWMQNDARCTPAMRDIVLRRLKGCLFDAFIDPHAVIPVKLQFVAEELYQLVPDKRLLNIEKTPVSS